jgi:hypothetical protein
MPSRTPKSLLLCTILFCAASSFAAEAKPAPATAKPKKLSQQQQQIADQFKHLEEVLLRMAELTASSDPRRAALLKKAVAQSKEQLVDAQFDRLVELLQKDQLSKALEGQATLDRDLQAILDLLMSENRATQLDEQKKRLQEYLKRVNELIKEQKNIQGRTAGGENPKSLSAEQGTLTEKTGSLAQQIKTNEEGKAKPDAKEPIDGKERDEKNQDQRNEGAKKSDPGGDGTKPSAKDQQNQPGKGDPRDKIQQGSKAQQSKESKPQDTKERQSEGNAKDQGQPQKSSEKQSEGQPKSAEEGQRPEQAPEPSPEQDRVPARPRLEAARDRMKEAEEKLKQAQRKDAVDKQEEALRHLEQAKAALEEILRQLRQEEVQRTLALLEARFRKMLDLQREVYDGTLQLDKVPAADRTQSHEIQSSQLGSKESQIVAEIDKAQLLLREDGTAAVFAEAIDQLRDDVQQVVVRLTQAKVEEITQGIERDVITALEEMIDALKKAQRDQKDQAQKPKAPKLRQGKPAEPPLVDVLAELKMIRALQMRVNTRTQRYGAMIEGEQAEKAELVEALRRLAERETRIHRVTRDLELGRSQ